MKARILFYTAAQKKQTHAELQREYQKVGDKDV